MRAFIAHHVYRCLAPILRDEIRRIIEQTRYESEAGIRRDYRLQKERDYMQNIISEMANIQIRPTWGAPGSDDIEALIGRAR